MSWPILFRPACAIAGAVATLFMLGGCLSRTVHQSELPADWLAALPREPPVAADIAGVYFNRGEVFTEDSLRRGVPGQRLFTQELKFAGQSVRAGPLVELRWFGPDEIEVKVTENERVLARNLFQASREKSSGAIVLRETSADAGGKNAAAFVGIGAVRLWKGGDGRLYARFTLKGAGVAFLVPYVGIGEEWGRWEPLTPENRNKLAEWAPPAVRPPPPTFKVRDEFPDFAVQDIAGEPLSLTALRGKVVVLCAWSTKFSPGQYDLARLQTLQRTHRDRGLELVILWSNQGGALPEVAEYVRLHNLAGRHYAERDGGANQLIALARMRGFPNVLVLDRSRNVAAVNPQGAALERAVAAALAPP